MNRKILFVLMWAAWCAVAPGFAADPREPDFAAGAWQAVDGSPTLLVEPNRLLVLEDGDVSTLPFRERRPDGWLLLVEGHRRFSPVTLRDGQLVLAIDPDQPAEPYRPLAEVPAALEIGPLDLPDPRPLPPARIEQIQAEIAERLERDQQAIKRASDEGSAEQAAADRVVEDNHQYLLSLLREVGWLDKARFGSKTSVQAAILAKHSSDLSLMLTILPLFERDFKNGPTDAQTYAIVFDSTQLMLGRPQRYGSQFEWDVDGNPIVGWLEEPEKVNERRAAVGLEPLEDYIALASKYLFDGAPVGGYPAAAP